MLSTDDIFGEMGLIENKPRSASAMALEDCRVSVMKRMEFNYLTKHRKDFFVALLRTLTERLRLTLKKLKAKPTIALSRRFKF
ncbi:MAG: cyclic nucleotide-binding domain-containing protein [Nitrospinae bacterium]|nr:cyclic nucleotide-binding domain-containing protein [Nitrospinota bacterium]